MLRRALVAAVAALGLAAAPAALASAPDIAGIGARSPALAGTGAADADGWEATYANPAGLVEARRRRLTVGYELARHDLSLDGAPRDVDPASALLVGAVIPLPLGGLLRDRVALGLAFHLPAGVINRARAPLPEAPRLALLDTRLEVVSVLVAAAVRLHARVTVGAGVIALAALVGEIRIQADAGGRVGTVAEEQLVVSYAPVVGARVRVLPSLALGAVLRGESRSDYDLRIVSDFGARLPLRVPTLRIAGVAQYDPLAVALEAAWRPRPWLGVIGGATWKRWSAFPPPTASATAGADPPMPPGFHDTVVPRLAVEVTGRAGPARLAGRAGYFFEPTPAPGGASPLVDADRHVITAGAGVAWSAPGGGVALDAFAQWHQLAGSPRAGGGFVVAGLALGLDL